MQDKLNGFTVVELIITATLFGFACVLFFIQKNNIEIIARDEVRKTAINAMYYSLEEVFYKTNGYYPQSVSSDNLKSVDPELFKDPNNVMVGTSGSDYTYTPTDCLDNKCRKYSLKTSLENEDDYIKTNRN